MNVARYWEAGGTGYANPAVAKQAYERLLDRKCPSISQCQSEWQKERQELELRKKERGLHAEPIETQ
jgi:hypothetical protein